MAPVLPQFLQDVGDVFPALPFIGCIFAIGETAEMGDQGIAICQAVGSDAVGDAGSQDLLGASAPDAEQEF